MSKFLSTIVAPTLGVLVAAGSVSAQTYKVGPIKKGLTKPTGIAVEARGTVLFTEIPEPGKKGGKNTVSRLDPKTGKVTVLAKGEPAPTNIAVARDGSFYWTCMSAGVVMRMRGNKRELIAKGLNKPSGIAVDGAMNVYITTIPEPGKKGGKNTVGRLVNGRLQPLSVGEPEPTDIVADVRGNLYWTCRTAGVILRRDARTGKKSLVLNQLEKPTGIAMDALGALYFTEVPTPGVFGRNGGRNRVWRYNPMTHARTLVAFGFPWPIDVTVTRDGKSVFFPCKTVGVMVRADRTGSAPELISRGTGKIGTSVSFRLTSVRDRGNMYQLFTTAGLGPIAVDKRFLAVAPDGLFFLSMMGAQGLFAHYTGRLDRSGRATATLSIPNAPILRGLHLYSAFVTFAASAPSGVSGISNTLGTTIE